MSQNTPSRRKTKRDEQYVPYNAKPKEVGTRTGKPMPKNVPLNSDGFEDPMAFFKSPADGLTSARSVATRRDFDTPGGVSAYVTPAAKRGRMSALALGSDEEDGSALGKGLLDEDDVLDERLSSPGPYFPSSRPPNVKLPRQSQPSGSSPAVDYDHLPTPKGRQSTIGTQPSPGTALTGRKSQGIVSPSRLGDGDITINGDMGGFGDEMDLDDAMASQAIRAPLTPSSTSASPKRNRKSNGRFSDATTEPNHSMEAGTSGDMADDDDGSDAGGPSFTYGDDGGFGDDMPENVEDEDDETAMEEEAVARENVDVGSDEDEEADQEPLPRGTKAKKGPKQDRRKRATTSQDLPKPKRKRVSKFGVADDDLEYEGDFVCRRSGRRHFKPLKYWMGERFEYQRGQYQPTITEVLHIPEEVIEPLGAKRRRTGRSASVKPTRWGAEEGWDANTEPGGLVMDFVSESEIQRRIAWPQHMLAPKDVPGGNFQYQKVFGEDLFIAAGVVYIPVGSSKPSKASKDNAYVFYVISGAVQVTIHRTSFIVAPGGMFMVPRGNQYEIENVSPETQAELFFAQARKILANEADLKAIANGKDKASNSRATSAVADAEEDSEETPREKTKRTKVKGRKSEGETELESEAPTPRSTKKAKTKLNGRL